MENTSENKKETGKKEASKYLCTALLAHVDSGKTTLAEAILYLTGQLRHLGRVDHRDAFLDTDELEKSRGITIFSKQAEFPLGDRTVTLLDTPGHVDFSAEMERTLQVLDCAVLVISAADGITGHVNTLWKLLTKYQVPVFIFVNKMDQPGADESEILQALKKSLGEGCVDLMPSDIARGEDKLSAAQQEELAVCDEELLERYLEGEAVGDEDIRRLVRQRRAFPCYFGSALRLEGVDALLNGLEKYAPQPLYREQFGARVYKISRDGQGNRLTHMKITGGRLRVKDAVAEEKVDQIRIYSGTGYQTVDEACAGCVCAVTGLTKTHCGQGLGADDWSWQPMLEPVLTYRLLLPQENDIHGALAKLRQLEEEEPMLHVIWDEKTGEIHVQVMGEVQIEILRDILRQRFGLDAEFGAGSIVYKETIEDSVEGIGHFEPLRHYAEVHLLLEPAPRGSGLHFDTVCSEDMLDRNWQRLILTHLAERQHPGVLTGSEITDMRITLLGGRAHKKHTEGGDFRQATYRAVRQGLKKARSILLEPVYNFWMRVPSDCLGRAMTDLRRMHGEFGQPEIEEDGAVLTGTVPAASLGDYGRQMAAYTRGQGQLSCELKGYERCHNEAEVIAACGYDAEADADNPTGSVFCSHGAGYQVPWYEVDQMAHMGQLLDPAPGENIPEEDKEAEGLPGPSYSSMMKMDQELEEIFVRTYGPIRQRRGMFDGPGGERAANSGREETSGIEEIQERAEERGQAGGESRTGRKGQERQVRQYLLVDGYNIIFSWPELNELSKTSMEAARGRLMDILSNYQGYRKMTLILVFDAYRVEGGTGEIFRYHNIHVVFTREAETADQYIEKTVHEIGRRHEVTVATSDALEQVIILGQGARRMSASEFYEEVKQTEQEIRRDHLNRRPAGRRYLFDEMDEELAVQMERIRLGWQETVEENPTENGEAIKTADDGKEKKNREDRN